MNSKPIELLQNSHAVAGSGTAAGIDTLKKSASERIPIFDAVLVDEYKRRVLKGLI